MAPERMTSHEPKEFAAFVVSMALEPRMLTLSIKVAPKSLRHPQASEIRVPVKSDNTPKVLSVTEPGAKNFRATLARMR